LHGGRQRDVIGPMAERLPGCAKRVDSVTE
jgi:hypothetical protein